MKKDKFEKAYRNNYLKLYQLAFQSENLLFSEIKRIVDIFGFSDFDFIPIDPAKFRKGENFENLLKFSKSKIDGFFKKATKQKKIKFFGEIEKSRNKLKLGKEWKFTLIRVALSGIYLPPPFGAYYEEDESKKIINFEINKDTTKFDLDLAWDSSADLRKKLFGKERSFYATKKTIDNFNLNANSLIKKHALKNKGAKITDAGLVVELFPNVEDDSKKSDLRLVSKLRTNRSRQKRK